MGGFEGEGEAYSVEMERVETEEGCKAHPNTTDITACERTITITVPPRFGEMHTGHNSVHCLITASEGSVQLTTGAGRSTTPTYFRNLSPTIAARAGYDTLADDLATEGGDTLEWVGYHYQDRELLNVTIGGRPCNITFFAEEPNDDPESAFPQFRVKCTVPPGSGKRVNMFVVRAGQFSEPQLVSYGAPNITHTNATNFPTPGQSHVALYGQNFGVRADGGLAFLGPFVLSCPTWTHWMVGCDIPPGSGQHLPLSISEVGRQGQT
jgi:hypothetical protein